MYSINLSNNYLKNNNNDEQKNLIFNFKYIPILS